MKLIVLSLLALVSTTQAIKCYGCSGSAGDGTCPADASGLMAMDCTPTSSLDFDRCMILKTNTGDNSFYSRSCSTAALCTFAISVNSQFAESKCCNTDNCNGDFASIPAGGGGGGDNPPEETFQCYSCATSYSDSCSNKVDCTVTNPTCYRTKTDSIKVLGIGADATYTYGCSTKDQCAAQQTAADASSLISTTCCDTTLCNAGATVKVSIVAMLVAVLVALWARN